MNDEQYLEHCRSLLSEFAQILATRTKQLPEDHPLRELAAEFQSLDLHCADFYAQGADLVARLFDTYPEFSPTFPRQLLWFFGGNCLHYMADDEIVEFQQLETARLST
ncbi:MAG: PA2817 family protein [Halioglobus sp.]|nr:PA2817 family protein [Halioglobus sp.]